MAGVLVCALERFVVRLSGHFLHLHVLLPVVSSSRGRSIARYFTPIPTTKEKLDNCGDDVISPKGAHGGTLPRIHSGPDMQRKLWRLYALDQPNKHLNVTGSPNGVLPSTTGCALTFQPISWTVPSTSGAISFQQSLIYSTATRLGGVSGRAIAVIDHGTAITARSRFLVANSFFTDFTGVYNAQYHYR
jgi:hypothetical protein